MTPDPSPDPLAPGDMSVVRGRRVRPVPPHREVYDPREDSRFRWEDSPGVIAEASTSALARRLMQRARVTGVLVVALLVVLGGLLAARRAPAVFQGEPTDSTARGLFLALRTDALREAGTRAGPLERVARSVQTDDEGLVIAVRDRVSRGGTLLRDTTTGTFTYGLFRDFESAVVREPDPANLFALIPTHLAEVLRTPDAYVFAVRPDTVLADRPARVVEARARQGGGDGHNVRRVTVFLDPSTPVARGIAIDYAVLALWYREDARMQVETVPDASGRTLPHRTTFRTVLAMPFQPDRPLTTTVDFRAAPLR